MWVFLLECEEPICPHRLHGTGRRKVGWFCFDMMMTEILSSILFCMYFSLPKWTTYLSKNHTTIHHAAERWDFEFGSNTTEKFQNSLMFAVNTTTRAASNLNYLQFCSSQPLLSPGTVHQKIERVFKILSEFSKFEWASFKSNTTIFPNTTDFKWNLA